MGSQKHLRENIYRRRVFIIFLFTFSFVHFIDICEARSPLLHLKDNSYHNLVIGISSSVAEDENLIEKIMHLLTETSQQLFIASKQHVYFKQITLVLPSSRLSVNIKNNLAVKRAIYETFEEADIKVEDPNPQKTDLPYTIQTSGCGQRGLSIHLSPSFILAAKDEKIRKANAKRLVREWAYYQYGVFEECGYMNDELSPQFYFHDNILRPSGCMQNAHDGKFEGNCSVNSLSGIPGATCKFSPKQHHSSTSLLYQPTGEHVTNFCDSTTHNFEAPTKQNILCQEKSAWDVIKNNEDFKNISPLNTPTNTTPTFNLVISSNVTYVVLLEQSNSIKAKNKLDAIEAGLNRYFSNYLPNDNVAALVLFSNESSLIKDEIFVNDTASRKKLQSGIPENTPLIETVDLAKGISHAAQIFRPVNSFQMNRKILLLISSGNWVPADVNAMCSELNNAGARLVAVICPDGDKGLKETAAQTLQTLTACTNGTAFIIPNILPNNYAVTTERIDAALRASLRLNEFEENLVQAYAEHFGKPQSSLLSGSFKMDEYMIKPLFRASYDKRNGNIETVKLFSPDGQIYEASKQPIGPAKVHEFKDFIPGVWKYEIKLYEHLTNLSVSVAVISEPNIDHLITVKCWTRAMTVDADTAFILYAEVKQRNAPIVNANVTATIYEPTDESGARRAQSIPLYDNGNGDPDISINDGIYSRYLTDLPRTGFYALEVSVEDMKTETRILEEMTSEETNGASNCQRPSYRSLEIGSFKRFALGPSFYITKPIYQSQLPPNRIADLRIHKVDPLKKQVELSWTSAGENYDWGEVLPQNYQIQYSTNRQELVDHFDNGSKLESNTINKLANNEILSTVIKVPDSNLTYYLAIKTVNRDGLWSSLSNIVSAYVPIAEQVESEMPTTTLSSHQSNQTKTEPPKKTTAAKAGAIIGIVVAIIFVIIILVVIWKVTVNRRNKRIKSEYDAKNSVKRENAKDVDDERTALTVTDEISGNPEKKTSNSKEEVNTPIINTGNEKTAHFDANIDKAPNHSTEIAAEPVDEKEETTAPISQQNEDTL